MNRVGAIIALILAALLIYLLLREPEHSDTYRYGVYCPSGFTERDVKPIEFETIESLDQMCQRLRSRYGGEHVEKYRGCTTPTDPPISMCITGDDFGCNHEIAHAQCPDGGQHLSPAFAEVDCLTGLYSGYRYRFRSDPVIHQHQLYWGKVFYPTAGMKAKCIYA